MKFQIEKLVIWPKKTQFPPREICFQLGKVNVITGSSRTGKTAIIPIVDYCLGSGTCLIPIDVIRDNAAWYGIVIVISSEKLLLARKVPYGNKVSTEYFYARGTTISIPASIEESNQSQNGAKELLDSIANVPYVNRGNDGSGYDSRLSFRDLTHLVFQSQDIMANQSILFYKTHETEHREKLKSWLPFILGAETAELIRARRELKELEAELKRRQKEFDKAKSISYEWLQNLIGKLSVAKEYGLYDGELIRESNQDNLLIIARNILDNNPESPKTSTETLTQARLEINKLEEEENVLSNKIAVIKKRQKDIDALEESLGVFHGSAKRKVDRLGIAEWIKKNKQNSNACPVCGGKEHPLANKEIEKICQAVKAYEQVSSQSLELPAAFQREKEALKTDLNDHMEKIRVLRSRFDVLRAQDEDAAKYLQRSKDMFTFIGELKSTVNLVERLSETGDLDAKIHALKQQIEGLNKLIASSNMRSRLERALEEISINMLNRLKTLDVEPKYKEIAPKFSLKELNIQIMDSEGVWHLLTEVGSASNWVSFHLALTCALQEFIVRQTQPVSVVPSFMIYDQPSQVYFPRIYIGESNDDPEYSDEDVDAVRNMFLTLAHAIHDTEGAWQAIVLDHARSDIYGGIEDVVEIEEWRNGKKLIPEIWCQD